MSDEETSLISCPLQRRSFRPSLALLRPSVHLHPAEAAAKQLAMKHNGDDSYSSSAEKLFSDEELSFEELPQPEDEGLEEHWGSDEECRKLFGSSSDEDQDHDKNYPYGPLIDSEDETEEQSDEEFGISEDDASGGPSPKLIMPAEQYRLEVLKGTHDPNSPLSSLRRCTDAIEEIFRHVDAWRYRRSIRRVLPSMAAHKVEFPDFGEDFETPGKVIEWPAPQGLNINMMPFDLKRPEDTLPREHLPYLELVTKSVGGQPFLHLLQESEADIAYLTIQESRVLKGTSQRRPGLHVESPGFARRVSPIGFVEYSWGDGYYSGGKRNGGIYMASSVANSTRMWPDKKVDKAVVGKNGDIEHLRPHLGEGVLMEPGVVHWMTDTTPHEALPAQEDMDRQYVRLVVGKVTAWYREHSTPNPYGVEPDAIVIEGSKF